MGDYFRQGFSSMREHEVGVRNGTSHAGIGNLSDAKGNIGHALWSDLRLKLPQECRFKEYQLLQPNRISYEKVQFLKANVNRPGMAGHGLADEIVPAML